LALHAVQGLQATIQGVGFTLAVYDTDALRPLLAQCALGNRQAFETLYRSVSPRLHGVALRFMGRADLAEEVLQEAFVRIWYNASRYEAHLAAPMTWMVNITRNLAIDQLRKRREQPLVDGQQDAMVDDAPSAHDLLDSQREANSLIEIGPLQALERGRWDCAR
jgi:RNA polymerase sigma-70 factor (ECF subfamily)